MRDQAALFLALALAIPAGQASQAAPAVTGEHLLRRLAPVDPADVNFRPGGVLRTRALVAEHRETMNQQYVEGYIEAVHDATEGTKWCFNQKYQTPNPDTLWRESKAGLGRLSSAQLRRRASDLLVEIWREKWPCPSVQRGQK
jgi:hypothetical protein